MFNSKSFTVIIILTMLTLGAAVALQFMEMQEYNLVEKLYRKYFASNNTSAETTTSTQEPSGDASATTTSSGDDAVTQPKNDADSTTENP